MQVPQAVGVGRLAGIFEYYPSSGLVRGRDDLQVRGTDCLSPDLDDNQSCEYYGR